MIVAAVTSFPLVPGVLAGTCTTRGSNDTCWVGGSESAGPGPRRGSVRTRSGPPTGVVAETQVDEPHNGSPEGGGGALSSHDCVNLCSQPRWLSLKQNQQTCL